MRDPPLDRAISREDPRLQRWHANGNSGSGHRQETRTGSKEIPTHENRIPRPVDRHPRPPRRLRAGAAETAPLADTGDSTLAQARAADQQPGRFERVDYLGNACDEGSATTAISPDGQAVTSIFSAFVAAAGPGTPAEQASLGCLLLARVEVPPGWQYSIESIDTRGFVSLEDDVDAELRALYIISGNPARNPPPRHLRGRADRGLHPADVGPDAPSGWSSCGEGQDLWIAMRAEVDNSDDDDSEGQLAVDSIDGELQWHRCSNSSRSPDFSRLHRPGRLC